MSATQTKGNEMNRILVEKILETLYGVDTISIGDLAATVKECEGTVLDHCDHLFKFEGYDISIVDGFVSLY